MFVFSLFFLHVSEVMPKENTKVEVGELLCIQSFESYGEIASHVANL